jgi:hypothetical protein
MDVSLQKVLIEFGALTEQGIGISDVAIIISQEFGSHEIPIVPPVT